MVESVKNHLKQIQVSMVFVHCFPHVLVTLPKERPSGSGIMIDLADQQIFTNKNSGEMGESQLKVRSIFLKEPDRLGEWAPRTWRRGKWSHGDRAYFPLRIGGNVGTLPNDPNYLPFPSLT